MTKKKKIFWITGIIVILALVGWRMMANKKPLVEYTTAKATKTDLLQTVSESGSVKALNELELNFLGTGRVTKMAVKVNDEVKKDQVLAEIDYADLDLKKAEAEAQLAMSRAQMDKLLAGATIEDLDIAEANYEQAKSSYEASVKELDKVKNLLAESLSQAGQSVSDLNPNGTLTPTEQAVSQAMTVLENTKKIYAQSLSDQSDSLYTSMKNKIPVMNTAMDAVDKILDNNEIKDFLSAKDTEVLLRTKESLSTARVYIKQAEQAVAAVKDSTDNREVKEVYIQVNRAISESFRTVNYAFNALEKSITAGSTFSQTVLDGYKTSVSAQITSVSAAIQDLQSRKQALDSAILNYDSNVANAENQLNQARATYNDTKNRANNSVATTEVSNDQQLTAAENRVLNNKKALSIAEAQLNKTRASARVEDITVARAQIRQAQISVELIDNQIKNNKILAPFDGIIIETNFKVGELASAANPAIKMMAKDGYEIEIDVSETDVAKVRVDNPAVITFDAFGDSLKFTGKVTSIDPAQTVIQGVIYYRVKIDFEAKDVEIKPGMTATADITTAKREGVINIPYRAVIDKDDKKIVRILKNGEPEEKEVKIGLNGDGGQVEILSGLNEGDDVITFTKNNAKTDAGK